MNKQVYIDSLWQSKLYENCKKSYVPCIDKTYQSSISLHLWMGTWCQNRTFTCHVKRLISWYIHKAFTKNKFCKFRKAIGVYNLEDVKILVVVVNLSIK